MIVSQSTLYDLSNKINLFNFRLIKEISNLPCQSITEHFSAKINFMTDRNLTLIYGVSYTRSNFFVLIRFVFIFLC
jgi:hypothetical protein